MSDSASASHPKTRVVARVLLVDDDPRVRLTLKTVLEAGGYGVETAASAAEAAEMLAKAEYELVLSDLHMESRDAGRNVLAQARAMRYRPATAFLASSDDRTEERLGIASGHLIGTRDLPDLLSKVASLISHRASRNVLREIRAAATAGAG